MIPTIQVPADLWLVIAGEGLPGSLTVLKQATLSWRDYEATFRVLSESHEVVMRRGDRVVLHEILSCAQVAGVADPPHVHLHSFGDGLAHSYEREGYSIRVSIDDIPPGAIVPHRSNLWVAFPNAVGSEATPVTSIQWEERDDELVWRTIHLYALPGRVVGVFTTSRVRCSVGRVGPRSPLAHATGRS